MGQNINAVKSIYDLSECEGTQRICPECGKEFTCYLAEGWAYKIFKGKKAYYYCSYSCLRKAQRENYRGVKCKECGKIFKVKCKRGGVKQYCPTCSDARKQHYNYIQRKRKKEAAEKERAMRLEHIQQGHPECTPKAPRAKDGKTRKERDLERRLEHIQQMKRQRNER